MTYFKVKFVAYMFGDQNSLYLLVIHLSFSQFQIMADVNVPPTPTIEDFAATGRTGRRNAMADILDSNHASVSTADLPFDMEKLTCSGIIFTII